MSRTSRWIVGSLVDVTHSLMNATLAAEGQTCRHQAASIHAGAERCLTRKPWIAADLLSTRPHLTPAAFGTRQRLSRRTSARVCDRLPELSLNRSVHRLVRPLRLRWQPNGDFTTAESAWGAQKHGRATNSARSLMAVPPRRRRRTRWPADELLEAVLRGMHVTACTILARRLKMPRTHRSGFSGT